MSHDHDSSYPSALENLYCCSPRDCRSPDVMFLGSGIALGIVPHLLEYAAQQSAGRPQVVVADSGPLDLITHMAHAPGFPRHPLLRAGADRMGGKLSMWGVSAPRPRPEALAQWSYYDPADLQRRFEAVEATLGVPDPIPFSGRLLEARVRSRLEATFPHCPVRVAPLAINADGQRWCPLAEVPRLHRQGGRFLARFRCTELVCEGPRVTAVRGRWLDGRDYTLRPKVVALGVGVEPSLPLVRQLVRRPLPLQAADHLRIDLHGALPGNAFGEGAVEEQGVCVLLMECSGGERQLPYHLEVKVAPRALWRRGLMQSSDNLGGDASDATLYVQVQAVAAMHDRLPADDLLQVEGPLPPVMSARDALFHGEIIQVMKQAAAVLGLDRPTFSLRPLLTNHHVYGAYRVGGLVSSTFRCSEIENCYILPPSAYVDHDDDANPTLKSLVLAGYAAEDMVRAWLTGNAPRRLAPN